MQELPGQFGSSAVVSTKDSRSRQVREPDTVVRSRAGQRSSWLHGSCLPREAKVLRRSRLPLQIVIIVQFHVYGIVISRSVATNGLARNELFNLWSSFFLSRFLLRISRLEAIFFSTNHALTDSLNFRFFLLDNNFPPIVIAAQSVTND